MKIFVSYCEKCEKISHYGLSHIDVMNACKKKSCINYCVTFEIADQKDVKSVAGLTNTPDFQINDSIEKLLREEFNTRFINFYTKLNTFLTFSNKLQLGILSKDLTSVKKYVLKPDWRVY